MAATNVQAFSGDVEVADTLTATNLVRGVAEEAVRWNSQSETVFPQSATTRYYKIATLGTTGDGANGGKLRISGTIGGFNESTTTLIDAFVTSRSSIKFGGTLSGYGGDGTVNTDIVVYLESDGTFAVWLKLFRFFTFDFTIMGAQVSNNTRACAVLPCPTTNTSVTTPTGTLQGSVVDSCSIVFTDDGNVGIGTTNPTGVNGGNRLEGSSSTGFEYIATRDDTEVANNDFMGAYLIKGTDTSGTAPHYVGMSASANGINSFFNLNFFSGRDNYENNTPQMVIDPDGNVGIGTDDPGYTLDINGYVKTRGQIVKSSIGNSDSRPAITETIQPYEIRALGTPAGGDITNPAAGNGFLRIGAGGAVDTGNHISYIDFSGYSSIGDMDRNIVFGTSEAERMRIDRDGNVGIGTASPECMLHLSASTASSDITDPITIKINNRRGAGDWSTTQPWGLLEFDTNDTGGAGTGPVAGVGCRFEGTGGGNSSLCFYTDNDGSNDNVLGPANERMCIDHDGNVGIGTTNPGATLDIKANRNSRIFIEDSGTDSGTYYQGLYIGSPVSDTDAGLRMVVTHDSNTTGNRKNIIGFTNRSLEFSTFSDNDVTSGFGIKRVEITTAGNFGIAKSGPTSYLSIRGNYSNSQAPVTYNSAPPLCVVNPTSTDGQPICQFRTNQGITNIRNDGLYHKRGNGDILQLFTSSSNVRFKNGTTGGQLELHNNGTAYFNCNLRANNYSDNSDDRIKHNESSIKNAIQTLFKLKPQKYDKVNMDIDVLEHSQYLNATDKEGYEWNDIEDGWIKRKPITSSTCETETGLIAQDIWYDAPELRHIVNLPDDAIPDDTKPSEPDPGNIRSDPDYDSAGWGKMGPATVNYINLIPYMIKSIKELYNEVTRHKTRVPSELYSNVQDYHHMIVSKHGDNIQLANTENDKAVHGVISDIKTDTDNYEILIEHIGMGNVWVLNTGSNIEVGDYITTSNITGYGMLQDSTYFMNHTIGKSTIDCDFTVQTTPIKQKIRRLQDKTYWIKTKRLVHCSLMAYSNLSNDTRTTEIETYYNTYENVLELSNVEQDAMQYIIDNEQPIEIKESEMNFEKYSNTYAVNTPFHTGPQTRTNYYRKTFSKLENELEGYEPIVEQEMMDVLDDNGQVQWEDTGDTRPLYDLRYLTIDGSITDQSNAVYTASLVPISLHL